MGSYPASSGYPHTHTEWVSVSPNPGQHKGFSYSLISACLVGRTALLTVCMSLRTGAVPLVSFLGAPPIFLTATGPLLHHLRGPLSAGNSPLRRGLQIFVRSLSVSCLLTLPLVVFAVRNFYKCLHSQICRSFLLWLLGFLFSLQRSSSLLGYLKKKI